MTRDAAGIGAGLAAAREAHRIAPGERIHVVGVAGAGASAAALLAQQAGAIVSGCDAGGPSPYSEALEAAGIELAWGHDPSHVTNEPVPTRLAVTKALTAIDPDHPELAAARAAGIPLESWQQVVADAAIGRTLVGVAGTHGKSTSAGWLVHTLVEAGLDPSAFVGALLPEALTGGLPSTARSGQGTAFVVEADEYAGNFDAYRPDVAVITGAEWDHPDVFADRDAVVDAFVAWLRRAPTGATAVVNVADLGGSLVATALEDVAIQLVATALLHDRATDEDLTGGVRALEEGFATAAGPARALLGASPSRDPTSPSCGSTDLAGPAIWTTSVCGPPAGTMRPMPSGSWVRRPPSARPARRSMAGVASFGGVGRRLERKGAARDVVVYDDYGHHPTAIRETIGAIRQREPGRRVWAVYEPLTYHRTAALLSAFADALATADAVVVADIWAGRDPDTTVASAAGLAAAVARLRPGIPIAAPGSVDASADWLAHEVRPGDAVLVMGGGHSYQIATGLLQRLETSEAS